MLLLVSVLAVMAPIFLWRELSLRIREVRAHGWIDHVSSSLRGRSLSYGISFWYPWPQTAETRIFGTALSRESFKEGKRNLRSVTVWLRADTPEIVRTDNPHSEDWISAEAIEIFPSDTIRRTQALGWEKMMQRIEERQHMDWRERRNAQPEPPLALAMSSCTYAWPLPNGSIWYEGMEITDEGRSAGSTACWIDPKNPAEARLQRESVWIWAITTLLITIPAALFLSFSAIGGIRRLGRK